MLPKKDGLEVLADIRAESELTQIPVVVPTASDAAADRVKCEFLQVDSFINKPVNLTKVLQVVSDLKRFWLNDVVLPKLDE